MNKDNKGIVIKQGDTTDCQTEEGITVSIIDTVSFLLGLLSKRNLESANVKEAIKDLQTNGKFNVGSKVYTLFISQKDDKIPSFVNGKRDYTVDEREHCWNCKRKINPSEKVFRVSDYPSKPFTVKKKKLTWQQRDVLNEFNKLNHAIYCTDCTKKFDEIISKNK